MERVSFWTKIWWLELFSEYFGELYLAQYVSALPCLKWMVIVNYALNLLKAEQNYNVDDNHIALVILSAKLAAGEIFEIIDRVNK